VEGLDVVSVYRSSGHDLFADFPVGLCLMAEIATVPPEDTFVLLPLASGAETSYMIDTMPVLVFMILSNNKELVKWSLRFAFDIRRGSDYY
jgi:hypothetical protein